MDIIIFSTADWDNPFWTNKQHMAKTFEANGHNIIYVDSLGLRAPTFHKKDFSRIFKRLRGIFFPYKKVSQRVWRVSPFVLPFHGNKYASFFNKFYLAFLVKTLSLFLKFRNPIIWTYSPVSIGVIEFFTKNKVIYHCVDDISASPGMDAKVINSMENALAKRSDLIFVTAPALLEKLSGINHKTFYFNNVADYNHFAKAKTDSLLEEPACLQGIAHPRIIFIGAISEYKVNFEIIEYVAQNRVDWSWVMVGEIGEGQPGSAIGNLTRYGNIHFLGAKPYGELPALLRYSDVSVIPARLNDYTKSMFPMKFFEYLSAGKQVVLTDLPSVKQYSDLCYLSEDKDEFLSNLEKVLDSKEFKNPSEIKECCKAQTWQKRYEQMLEIMKEHDVLL